MQSHDLQRSLPGLFGELVHGARGGDAFILNRGDPGLLESLGRLSAAAASASSHGGATIAAHVEHVMYGLSLLNRWADGEADPFASADWSAAWRTTKVTDEEWRELRRRLTDEVERWQAALASSREVRGIALDGVIGSVIHLAYHLGAIRQIDAQLRGPQESA